MRQRRWWFLFLNLGIEGLSDISRSPAIRKYGLGYKKLEESDSSYILAKDLTVAALFSIFSVYSSGNLKEK